MENRQPIHKSNTNIKPITYSKYLESSLNYFRAFFTYRKEMSLTTLNLNAHLMHVHLVCAIFQIDAVQTIVHIFFQYMMEGPGDAL